MKKDASFSSILIATILLIATGLISEAWVVLAQPPSQRRPPRPQGQSPASQPRLKSATPQTYTEEQIHEGQVRFGAQCGFCHGKDASGGESGPDLTRSELVAQDVHGDKIGPVIRNGRPNTGMPAFNSFTQDDLTVVVAFLHSQMDKFSELGGGRRSVDAADLATGNATAGRAYFNGQGKCSSCHSATGDLAGIATRFEGLNLLRRMLYPTGGRGPQAESAHVKASIQLAPGETVVAPVVAEDEFSVTVSDPAGGRKTYQKSAVKVKIDDPLSAHFDQLGKYTDADMHNVYAYLETLK